MSFTKTNLVNQALYEAQISKLEDVESDNNEAAIVAREIYDFTRQAVLASHNWNFAVRRAIPARLSEVPSWGFQYAFVLPADFLRVVSVNDSGSDFADSVVYRIEGMDIDGTDENVLLTDSSVIYLRYVKDVKNINSMDPMFRKALSLALAAKLCKAIPGKTTLAEAIKLEFKDFMMSAKSSDAIQDYPEQRPAGSWANSRDGRRDTQREVY